MSQSPARVGLTRPDSLMSHPGAGGVDTMRQRRPCFPCSFPGDSHHKYLCASMLKPQAEGVRCIDNINTYMGHRRPALSGEI
jgi:hypothetical protein